MELKKNPAVDIYLKRPLFKGIGFVVSVALVMIAFEWKSYNNNDFFPSFQPQDNFEALVELPITPYALTPPVPTPTIAPVVIEETKKILEDVKTDLDAELAENFLDKPSKAEQAKNLMADVPALPVGGMAAFYTYVTENLQYPVESKKSIEGSVYIYFTVDTTGTIQDVKVLKGIGADYDQAALNVVSQAPAWQPARQQGVPIQSRILVPIHFLINIH